MEGVEETINRVVLLYPFTGLARDSAFGIATGYGLDG
jgi:hypothetical protein